MLLYLSLICNTCLFWDVAPCRIYRCFDESCSLKFQSRSILRWKASGVFETLVRFWWSARHHVPQDKSQTTVIRGLFEEAVARHFVQPYYCQTDNGLVVFRALICLLTANVRVKFQDNPCRMLGGQSGTSAGSISTFPCSLSFCYSSVCIHIPGMDSGSTKKRVLFPA
jgi:hypothetical protein